MEMQKYIIFVKIYLKKKTFEDKKNIVSLEIIVIIQGNIEVLYIA